ncbi:MAG TPA: glycoside hydrolase family 3 C-terminal domain-containing protein [Candidatus Aquilonibacter sp.]|jgi:beta-glucosidase|nr:glycoside hydrolase family 3 C-terminal domain-containing protein [Candidatus Aquilonibacter sp.]
MKRFLCLFVALTATLGFAQNQPSPDNPPYKNPDLPVNQRVQDLLNRMTLQEKVAMLSGANWMESVPNERLGIPSIKMADGPLGVRSWAGPSAETLHSKTLIYTTAFPSGIALGATWDTELARSDGEAIGQEVKALGRGMILGPTVNINRTPLWGRNFEGFGEDPYLTSRMGVAYIEGVQSQNVIATVKHFAANNQEFERHRVNAIVDERALQEIYFPAFKAAVQEAGVWSVMSAYNKLNGTYCAEDSWLLKDVLQKGWDFKGFVVSDWGSTYSTVNTVNAGMDLEMPGGTPMKTWIDTPKSKAAGNGGGWLAPDKVLPEVSAGKISEATIDDNVGRILRILFVSGQFDHPHKATGEIDTPEQKAMVRKAAIESIVLLKNSGDVLPLDATKIHSIAVIGPNAATARTGGGGSSRVAPKYSVAPLDGIKNRAGSVQVSYALGVSMEGEVPAKDTADAQKKLRDEAVSVAAKADIAVVVVGRSPELESEDFDIKSLDLPSGQDELISAVAKANKNTVVVINAGGPVIMSKWIGQVPAIVDMWYGGQEGGNAIADVLFGKANPSGKLPVSFVKEWKDSPAYGHYPGENLQVDYAEGIYVGYRYFDTKKVEPLFPFGYGLSYTKFDYSDLSISPANASSSKPVEVSLRVRNSGVRAGAEVVELYVHDGHASVDRPLQELKGFRRVNLAPGESQLVRFVLNRDAMAFYSTAKKDWIVEPGQFDVWVGSSSRDIRAKGSFEVKP